MIGRPLNASAWLGAVESFAVRFEDAPLALAALRARQHPGLHRSLACVLSELTRRAAERANDLLEAGERVSASVAAEGRELAALLADGWEASAELGAKGGEPGAPR